MKISNNFILEQIIMPNIKPAYKIIFIDEQNTDNLNYFNGLSYQERLLLKPYFMEIGGHWSEAHNSFVFIKEISTKAIREAIKKANNLLPLSKEQIEREKLQAYFTPPDIARKMQEFADISDDLLAQGGTLVGILGRNSILQRGANNEKSSILESFIDKFNSSKYHQIIKLEPGSFEVSGTICDTCMVVLEFELNKIFYFYIANIYNIYF